MPSASRWLAAGLSLICLIGEARALDPNHTLSQYLREQWTTDNNFPGGAIQAITQTADGYLWMGTEKGLVRFDGVNFRLNSSFSEFSGDPVSGLITDGDGRLCVIFWGAGVLCNPDGTFVNLASILRRTTLEVASSWREEDGASLLTDLIDGMLRVRGENVQVLAPPTVLPPSLVLAMAEARDGMCQVCHVKLRLQMYADLKRNEEIVQCPACNRILYYEPPVPVTVPEP